MSQPKPKKINRSLLKKFALPEADERCDKESRGQVLIIGGKPGMTGAVLLAAEAALRAGCGKVSVACPLSMREAVSAAIPEAYVAGPDEEDKYFAKAAATLIGPGLDPSPTLHHKVARLAADAEGVLILDAGAIAGLSRIKKTRAQIVITPHAGEMAKLTGLKREDIEERAGEVSVQVAKQYQITVVLKGADTHLVTPEGRQFYFEGSNPGLGVSGSGDVLAGLMVGLSARGAEPLAAALWSVFTHAQAGEVLRKEAGGIGFLARELPAHCPAILNSGGKHAHG